MAFGGLKKLIRKNKKGLGRLIKTGAKVALGAAVAGALPIVGSKIAAVGAGKATKLLGAASRIRAKKLKKKQLGAVMQVELKKPELLMTASRDSARPTHQPGGARVSGRWLGVQKSAMAMPGGAPISSGAAGVRARKIEPLGIGSTVKGFAALVKKESKRAAAKKGKALAAEMKREKKRMAAENKKAKAAARREAKAEAKRQRAADRAGGLLTSAGSAALGVKATGKGKAATRLAGKVQRKVGATLGRAARQAVSKSPRLAGLAAAGSVPLAGAIAGGVAIHKARTAVAKRRQATPQAGRLKQVQAVIAAANKAGKPLPMKQREAMIAAAMRP